MPFNDYLNASRFGLPANAKGKTRPDTARSDMESSHNSDERIRKRRILCVDDEIMATEMRAELLREHGYSIVVYHSPLTVLDCDLTSFDLAIVDFNMPGLNGRELFLRLRALGARFPVVLLTGCLETLSREDCVLFARCIDKGMSIHFLLDTVREFLDPNPIPDFGS